MSNMYVNSYYKCEFDFTIIYFQQINNITIHDFYLIKYIPNIFVMCQSYTKYIMNLIWISH